VNRNLLKINENGCVGFDFSKRAFYSVLNELSFFVPFDPEGGLAISWFEQNRVTAGIHGQDCSGLLDGFGQVRPGKPGREEQSSGREKREN
jgi:hypothetical protein